MIIGIEFLDCHYCTIRCIDCIFETNQGTFRILGRNKTTSDAAKADVSRSKQPVGKPTDPDKAALTRSEIRAAQTIHVPPMTQVPFMVL